MKLKLLLVIFSSATTSVFGESYDSLAGYIPHSDVRQHSRIDLDQRDFQKFLSDGDFAKASDIYVNGGNSMKTTKIHLSLPLTKSYPKFSSVSQGSASGTLSAEGKEGAMVLKVSVTSPCVGTLALNSDISGCFSTKDLLSAKISVGGDDYMISEVETPYRTLAGFSVQAESKMKGQRMFEMYKNYYGAPDYADKFVKAALRGDDETKRVSENVPFKFTGKDDLYRVECAQKGSAYWGLWMYVIRELEDGVNDCKAGCDTQSCNDAPVHAWDEAAAFYIGSLEGTAGNSAGSLLYRLAEKRCKNFETCGCRGDSACTNHRILKKIAEGRELLSDGKCEEVVAVKDRITSLMTIPLVQGTLRYARKIGEGSRSPKELAEGVAFAGSILPQLAACESGSAAGVLEDFMWIDAIKTSNTRVMWPQVKGAILNSVGCLGITVEDLGIDNIERPRSSNGHWGVPSVSLALILYLLSVAL